MGLIEKLLSVVFGGGRNVVAETAEVFRVNAEAQANRSHDMQVAALGQFGQEFRLTQRSWFDRLMDALNRLPRPAMALGTLGLFIAAMVDPVWFAERMAGIALVPEPLWWLLGAVVSFYFGARHQAKGQEFQRELSASIAAVPDVIENIRDIQSLRDVTPEAVSELNTPTEGPNEPMVKPKETVVAPTVQGAPVRASDFPDNPALADWAAEQQRG